MKIEYLADRPEMIPRLAVLHFEQWGYLRPEQTLDERTMRLRSACGRGEIPTVVVGVEGDELVGSAMLVESDMGTRPDLSPWLAGVYVVRAHRDRDHGSALVARIEDEAARLGVERLYLYTPDASAFYAKLGWSVDERCEYLGQQVFVMSRRLG